MQKNFLGIAAEKLVPRAPYSLEINAWEMRFCTTVCYNTLSKKEYIFVF